VIQTKPLTDEERSRFSFVKREMEKLNHQEKNLEATKEVQEQRRKMESLSHMVNPRTHFPPLVGDERDDGSASKKNDYVSFISGFQNFKIPGFPRDEASRELKKQNAQENDDDSWSLSDEESSTFSSSSSSSLGGDDDSFDNGERSNGRKNVRFSLWRCLRGGNYFSPI